MFSSGLSINIVKIGTFNQSVYHYIPIYSTISTHFDRMWKLSVVNSIYSCILKPSVFFTFFLNPLPMHLLHHTILQLFQHTFTSFHRSFPHTKIKLNLRLCPRRANAEPCAAFKLVLQYIRLRKSN